MAHTHIEQLTHCVFSTKLRAQLIPTEKQAKLWAYLFGIAKNLGVQILAVGGTTNHVHLLIAIRANQNLAAVVRDLKANSSRWMRETGVAFAWQQGYGGFSVSPSLAPVVKEYIRHQAEHHQKRDFEEEYLALLRKSGVSFDPRQVFD
jgi:REP element-mobilizing transposase RayT